jgi:hypothetical protein
MVVRNQSLIRFYGRSPRGPVGRMLKQKGLRVQNRARTLAPVRDGRLRASIVCTDPYETPLGQAVAIGSNVVYALAVHEGSGGKWAPPSWRAAHAAGHVIPARRYLTNALSAARG